MCKVQVDTIGNVCVAEEDEFYRVSLNCGLISFRGMQGQSLKETLMPAGRDREMP